MYQTLESFGAEACSPLCLIGHSNLVLIVALISFFIVIRHTVRVDCISLCQLSPMEDHTRVDQSAIEKCSVSLSSISCQCQYNVGIVNSRGNYSSEEVHQVFDATNDDEE
jgi:hypothetical protein